MALGRVLGRLYALAPRGARFGLDHMRAACASEGDPQDAVPAVHVAGTNGKGSVAAMVEAIARAAGLRTGLYTSPHLGRFAERIQVDGEPIADDALEDTLAEVLDRHPTLTFFEVATLAAFLHFRARGVELAALEVGLGGRLDATNVVRAPRVTAITSIGRDHTALLGEDLASIAREKAGILKRGVPTVLGPIEGEALTAITAHALAIGAGERWRVRGARVGGARVGAEIQRVRSGGALHVAGPGGRRLEVVPALAGAHQDDNAAVAVALGWRLGLPAPAIARGIAGVRWPGRLEEVTICDGDLAGRYLLDGAHNEEGARALADALAERTTTRGERADRRALVFGTLADKPWRAMIEVLVPWTGARVYTPPAASGGARTAASTTAFHEVDPAGIEVADLTEALRRARRAAGGEGTVVVAGSLYLVGEARSILLGTPRDPQVGL